MRQFRAVASFVGVLAAGALTTACDPPGIGDPCAPETTPLCITLSDGITKVCEPWAYAEVSVETRSVQCKTRTCMVYHFFPAGRISGETDWRYCTNPSALESANCTWPSDEAKWPCRGMSIESFVQNFCKRDRNGTPILNPILTADTEDDLHPWIYPDKREGWYCDFDMTLVNLSQPFCTVKCKGAGRTFDCPEGFTCKGEMRLGAEGMRGTYCVPERLADCNRDVQGDQDCCGN